MIKPAIPKSYSIYRADEIRQPGLIEQQFLEKLFEATIVLADLTFGNPNVYYELGIRQSLQKSGTILVAQNGIRLPFDVQGQKVLFYDVFHAPGLSQFQQTLRETIETAYQSESVDSPVYLFLSGLNVTRYDLGQGPSTIIENQNLKIQELELTAAKSSEQRFVKKLESAQTAAEVLRLHSGIDSSEKLSIEGIELLAVKLRKHGFLDESLELLQEAEERFSMDSEILREIGFVYRQKGECFYDRAEQYMKRAIAINEKDVELLGMLGGLLKRRCEFEDALACYKKAHELDPDNLYPLVNLGAMNAVMNRVDIAEAAYTKVADICEENLRSKQYDYWALLCKAEASIALAKPEVAFECFEQTKQMNIPTRDYVSGIEQIQFLRDHDYQSEACNILLQRLGAE